MRGLLQRKIGSKLCVADMIAQYLPLRELRIVAFVREHSIVTYCERRWKEARFDRRGLKSIRSIILYGLRNVTVLNLSKNQLQNISDTIGNCTQLQQLYLSWNQLQSIPDTIGNCVQLKVLELSGNQLQRIPDTIGNCVQLQTLALSENHLQSIPDTIGNCTQLQWLYLYRNQLQSIPDTFCNCVELLGLLLQNNPLTHRPTLKTKVKVYY
jgi:Leucine-rich repeat (LRR) protein